MSRRLFALVTALYPRAWRERYAEELSDLCGEFVEVGETTRLHLALTILFAAAVERFRSLRSSRHRVLLASSTMLVVALAAVTFATNGFGLLVSALPTKGPVPNDTIVNGQTDITKVPDFVAAVGKDGKIVGYVPKADLFPAATSGTHVGPQTPFEVQPVYASDLKTLVGHFYPGVGFVLYEAVNNEDYPLMQGIFLIITLSVLIANLLADGVYVLLDPRTRQDA